MILQVILPLCGNGKKMRTDASSWKGMGSSLSEQSEAGFSHGSCSECAGTLFPQYFRKTER